TENGEDEESVEAERRLDSQGRNRIECVTLHIEEIDVLAMKLDVEEAYASMQNK
ncbi:hypothetical protein HHI36_004789, partial [Cryptolaemus montrouzieri]